MFGTNGIEFCGIEKLPEIESIHLNGIYTSCRTHASITLINIKVGREVFQQIGASQGSFKKETIACGANYGMFTF